MSNKKSNKSSIVLILIILAILIFILLRLIILMNDLPTNKQKLKNLDFEINIESNGDVRIIETWDIKLSNTNTLYKNFEINNNLYSGISNVSVSEVTDSNTLPYNQISNYQYHLDNNTFYALNIGNGLFEIAWGVGADQSKERKKYQISYTIKDAITKYNDCSEFYWQFLGENFNISANKITGTITLPKGINDKEEIRAWGHLETLNGNIKIKDTETVVFNVNGYQANQYLEVRMMLPPNIIRTNPIKTKNINYQETILNEEESYANSSNGMRIKNYIINFIILIIIFVIVYFEYNTIKKYIKIIKESKRKEIKPKVDYQYFREIPNEKTTPGQAAFLLNSKNEPIHGDFSNVFIATILNLVYKKYFELKEKQLIDGKKETYLVLTDKSKKYKASMNYGVEKAEDLQEDEIKILEYLLKISGEKETLEIKEIYYHIKESTENTSQYLELMYSTQDKIEVLQSVRGYINTDARNMIKKYQREKALNIGIISIMLMTINYLYLYINGLLIYLMIFFILIPVVNIIILGKMKTTISYLTQKGVDEREKWDSLKNYIEDYSLLKEKNEFSIEVWEKFLIYATAFGVSKNVLKQLDIQLDNNLNNNSIEFHSMINYTDNFEKFVYNLNETVSEAIKQTNITSSAEGFGGGFSAGGGAGAGRSRRRRKIMISEKLVK